MAIDRLPAPERVLVVAAHPDDIEFGAAGTVARWVDGGAQVRYLLVTRGDKGSDDPSVDPRQLAERRTGEQRAAAAEIGVSGVDFLDEPDGQVEPSLPLLEVGEEMDVELVDLTATRCQPGRCSIHASSLSPSNDSSLT